MAKKRSSKAGSGAVRTAAEAAAQLVAIAAALALPEALPRAEHRLLHGRTSHVTDALIEGVARLSDHGGGSVAGMPFDATGARTVLAQAGDARALERAARVLARQAGASALTKRALVADRAFAVFTALERLVRTPEGKSLRTAYEELRKASRSRRRSSGKHQAAVAEAASNGATAHSITLSGTIGPSAASAMTNGSSAAAK